MALHEIIEARERTAEEWTVLRDREPVDSPTWGKLNALLHLRKALDRGDPTAAKVWGYVARQCREVERRAILLGGEKEECLTK